jgi:hypothetical protein
MLKLSYASWRRAVRVWAQPEQQLGGRRGSGADGRQKSPVLETARARRNHAGGPRHASARTASHTSASRLLRYRSAAVRAGAALPVPSPATSRGAAVGCPAWPAAPVAPISAGCAGTGMQRNKSVSVSQLAPIHGEL